MCICSMESWYRQRLHEIELQQFLAPVGGQAVQHREEHRTLTGQHHTNDIAPVVW